MEYRSYMHIERFGTVEVEGIELGTCYCFPKIDGTNASIWLDDNGQIQTGSRTRWLAEGQNDNAGFRYAVNNDPQFEGIRKFLTDNPNYRLYGEWLVPHTLKTYRQEAWRQFYVFDVTYTVIGDNNEIHEAYFDYNHYKTLCDLYNINYIPPIKIIKNGTYEDFLNVQTANDYLIEAGKGAGEGIVIKNYDYRNKFGRITWAKIVTSEFKEKHYKEMGAPEKENKLVEEAVAEEFCTLSLVEKTHAKIVNDSEGWTSKHIPRLLESVYHDLVVEEIYHILKKHNSPTINFKTLRVFVIQKIKQLKPELFS